MPPWTQKYWSHNFQEDWTNDLWFFHEEQTDIFIKYILDASIQKQDQQDALSNNFVQDKLNEMEKNGITLHSISQAKGFFTTEEDLQDFIGKLPPPPFFAILKVRSKALIF